MIHYTIDTLAAMRRLAILAHEDVHASYIAILKLRLSNQTPSDEDWRRHDALSHQAQMFSTLLLDFENRGH